MYGFCNDTAGIEYDFFLWLMGGDTQGVSVGDVVHQRSEKQPHVNPGAAWPSLGVHMRVCASHVPDFPLCPVRALLCVSVIISISPQFRCLRFGPSGLSVGLTGSGLSVIYVGMIVSGAEYCTSRLFCYQNVVVTPTFTKYQTEKASKCLLDY